MSQNVNPEYPILSSASFKGSPTTSEFDSDITMTSQIDIMSFAGHENCTISSSPPAKKPLGDASFLQPNIDYTSPPGSIISVISGVSLTSEDMQIMSDVLMRARQCRELPPTSSSPMDAKAVLEDTGHLKRLRELRGDLNQPAPQAYTQFHIEVTRRIQERDSYLREEEHSQEASRRVNHFARMLEKERGFFEAASPKATKSEFPQHDVEAFSTELLSIIERAADMPFRTHLHQLNKSVRHLHEGTEDRAVVEKHHFEVQKQFVEALEDQHGVVLEHHGGVLEHHDSVLEQHGNVLEQHDKRAHAQEMALKQQEDVVRSQQDMMHHQEDMIRQQEVAMKKQEIAMQQQNYIIQHQQNGINGINEIARSLISMLEPQARGLQASSENLTMLAAIVTHLSQVVVNLAPAVNQVVDAAVQEQTNAALRDVLEAQQQAMLSLMETRRRAEERLDYDLLASKVAAKLHAAKQTAENTKSTHKGGRLGRAFKKILRRRSGCGIGEVPYEVPCEVWI